MESSSPWTDRLASTIGRAIDAARRGRSDQWIADQSANLGHPLSRTAVSEYRRGKRKTVPVSDLIVIARILGVPPIALLFPGLPAGPVTLFPPGMIEGEHGAGTDEVAALDGLRWFSGEAHKLPTGWDLGIDPHTGQPGAVVMHLAYEHPEDRDSGTVETPESRLLDESRALARAYERLASASKEPDSGARLELLDAALEEIAATKARIARLGGITEPPTVDNG